MWVRLGRKIQEACWCIGRCGVYYPTTTSFDESSIIDYVLDKRQREEEILIMGYFNAHFSTEGRALDCRAKLLNRISKDLGMRILNFQAFTRGKWTCGMVGRSQFLIMCWCQMGLRITQRRWLLMMMVGLTLAVITICCFGKVFVALEKMVVGEWEKKRLHADARRIFGPGKQKGKLTGWRTRKKLREKWSCLGLICWVGRTGPQRKDMVFLKYLEEAAEESLGKVFWGSKSGK